jgi:hypothetical protein
MKSLEKIRDKEKKFSGLLDRPIVDLHAGVQQTASLLPLLASAASLFAGVNGLYLRFFLFFFLLFFGHLHHTPNLILETIVY